MKKFLLSLFLCLTLGTAAAWAQDYELVTSNDQIEEGAEYIVVNGTNAMALYVSGNNCKAVAINKNSDGTISLGESEANVARVSFESNGGNYYLNTAAGYLYVDSKNRLKAKSAKALDASVSISGTTANIVFTCSGTKYTLKCNPNGGTPLFACYASGQNDVQLYKKVEAVAAAPEAITATIDGEVIEAEQTVVNGTVVTFESKNAGALKINGETVENPYDYTVDFSDAKTLEVTVEAVPAEDYTPAEGEEMPVATYTFVREPAAECGAVEFTPAGGAVYEGTTIFLSCENAATIMYAVNGGTEKEYDAETGIIVSEACTIVAYGINADGVHGETAEYSFTIKEADRYKLITSTADLKSGAKYIIVSANGKTMGTTISSSKFTAASGTFTAVNNIITPGEDSGINVLEITVSGTGYKLYAEGNNAYLNAASGNTNLNTNKDGAIFDISFTSKGCAEIGVGTRQILYNGSVFGNYATSNADANGYYRSYLYRLIDEDYVAAPENLYLHGDFFDASWERSIEMERSGDVFTLTDIMIGHPDGGQHYLFATFPKAAPNESTTEKARRKAAAVAQDYWSDNEGHVFIPNGDGTATRLHTSEINGDITPAEAEKRGGYYDLTADFSGFTPTFAISEAKDITTGATAVEADDNAPVEHFNLQGIRVENPENGLYIRRQGSNTTKVYIR